MLLPVYKSHPIDVIILIMIRILVPAHDELLLNPLQTNGPHRLGSITRDVHISHVLIVLIASRRWQVLVPLWLHDCGTKLT